MTQGGDSTRRDGAPRRDVDAGRLVLARRHLRPLAAADADTDLVLGRRLGAGTGGEVLAAVQRTCLRPVAVKRLSGTDPAEESAFIAEAVAAGALAHPGILPVHELVRDEDGRLATVMPLSGGRTWADLLPDLDLDENLRILVRVCEAVAYAHSRGVLHRDLKPDNVLLGDFGEVLVADWGLAAAVPGAHASPAPRLHDRTEPAGTPCYMAPEMARGDGARIGIASDVYLLGAILYELLTGFPPHPGETDDACLAAARANRIRPVKPGGELLAAALRALADDPADRFAGAEALRGEILQHLEHAQSLRLSERARSAFERAQVSGDYRCFARALFGFEEALALWPQNRVARSGLTRSRLAYAETALKRGDLDLCASLCDPRDPAMGALRDRLAAVRRDRSQDAGAQERLRRLYSERVHEDRRRWLPVHRLTAGDAAWAEHWEPANLQVTTTTEGLQGQAGLPGLLIFRRPVPGDVRLSFTCTIHGQRLTDVSCFLSASRGNDPALTYRTGYELKFGCFDNTRIRLYRQGHLLHDAAAAPLRDGGTYRVVAERIGNRLRLEVDGRECFTVEDELPPTGTDQAWLGFFGWDCTYTWSDVRIERLALPGRIGLLDLAGSLLSAGRFASAADLYHEAERAHGEPHLTEQARAGEARARRLARLADDLPALRDRLRGALPGAEVTLAEDGLQVSASRCGITDLAPLAGLPITNLVLRDNHITDLRPLAGLPLRMLDLTRNQVADLAPLAGAPLTHLVLNANPVADLTPLRDLPLVTLGLTNTAVADLGPMAGAPLRRLDASYTRISDLGPLHGMPLDTLDISACAITQLRSLTSLRLRSLQMSHCPVGDLIALTGMPLLTLHAVGCGLTSIDPLAGMPLGYLDLDGNRIESLDPLRGMDLRTLKIQDNRITSLAPLVGMRLHAFDCDGNLLTDLYPVADDPPPHFNFSDNPIPPERLRDYIFRWSAAGASEDALRSWRALLLLRSGREDALRDLALLCEDRRWLPLPIYRTITEARALAARAGGRLPIPDRPTLLHALRTLARPHGAIPLGLRSTEGPWDDGTPFTGTVRVETAGQDVCCVYLNTLEPWLRLYPGLRTRLVIEWPA